jgi:hypothetical protein
VIGGCIAPPSPLKVALDIAKHDPRLNKILAPRPGARFVRHENGSAVGSPLGGLKLELPRQADAPLTVRRGSEFVRLRFEDAKHAPVAEDKGRLVAPEAAPNTDFILAPICELPASGDCVATGVEWALLVRRAEAVATYNWSLETSPGLSPLADHLGQVAFVDAGGQAHLRALRPYAIDAKGTRRDAELLVSATRLTVRLDTEGLVFPVLLDPSIEAAVWESPPDGLHVRWATAVFDQVRKRVVAFGGSTGFGQAPVSSTWEWADDVWTLLQPPNSPSARCGHFMAYDSIRKRIVLFGGSSTFNQTFGNLNDTWEWDGTNWTKLNPTTKPSFRSNGAMAFDAARGKVVLFGGSDAVSGISTDNTTWLWDGVNWTAAATPSGPSARYGHSMAFDPIRSRVVLVGGWTWNPQASGYQTTGETWEWDGSLWLQAANPLPQGQSSASFVFDSSRGVPLLVGGADRMGTVFSAAWSWDGISWQQIPTSTIAPPPRYGSVAAYDPIKDLIVFSGGSDDTWELIGTNWLERPPRPSRRTLHAAAYDPNTKGVLVFGGLGTSGFLDDTWLWNGKQWRQLSPTTSPPARHRAAAATDFKRGKVILFGGEAQTGITYSELNDTWEWDGTNWKQLMPPTSPSIRQMHSMAWVPPFEAILLFGGYGSATGLIPQTWSWNGSTWTQLTPLLQPVNGTGQAMAWSAPDSEIVLFDGNQGPGDPPPETWTWDGGSWTKRPELKSLSESPRLNRGHAVASSSGGAILWGGNNDGTTWRWRQGAWNTMNVAGPPGRADHTLVEDPQRHRVVLFGGAMRNDLWEYHVHGNSCSRDGECDTGHCVDGVCCESSCGGGTPFDCLSCSRANGGAVDGVCGPIACPDQGPCLTNACNPLTGQCVGTAMANGTICDDNKTCTAADSCLNGSCAGSPVVDGGSCFVYPSCFDAWQCSAGNCVPASPLIEDGRSCNDDNPCTISDTCKTGGCMGTALPNGMACDDGVGCTTDSCNSGVCTSIPAACSPWECGSGACAPDAGRCIYVKAAEGAPCSDFDKCTQVDACVGGFCVGARPVVCHGGGECQAPRTCEPATGACAEPRAVEGAPCPGGVCGGGVCLSPQQKPDAGFDGGPDAGLVDAGGSELDAGAGHAEVDAGSGIGAPSGCGCSEAGSTPFLALSLLMWVTQHGRRHRRFWLS